MLLVIPRNAVLLEKPPAPHLVNKFSTWTLITVFTVAPFRSSFRAILIQLTPSHPLSLRFILILFCHWRRYLLICLFLSGFPKEIVHAFVFSPIRASCSAHFILMVLIALKFFPFMYTILLLYEGQSNRPKHVLGIVQYKPTKCTFPKLLFYLWCLIHVSKFFMPYLYVQPSSWRWTLGFKAYRRHHKLKY